MEATNPVGHCSTVTPGIARTDSEQGVDFGDSPPRSRDVDLVKIGRVNYLPMTKTTDWKTYTERMVELCSKLGVQHYVKRDLQPHLPAGYHNPLRVPQHHGSAVQVA